MCLRPCGSVPQVLFSNTHTHTQTLSDTHTNTQCHTQDTHTHTNTQWHTHTRHTIYTHTTHKHTVHTQTLDRGHTLHWHTLTLTRIWRWNYHWVWCVCVCFSVLVYLYVDNFPAQWRVALGGGGGERAERKRDFKKQSSGVVWKSRWSSWAFRPYEPSFARNAATAQAGKAVVPKIWEIVMATCQSFSLNFWLSPRLGNPKGVTFLSAVALLLWCLMSSDVG